ncbi:hypothetical protein J4429_00795 [Candidatus Pacearchaeota archaeon]|nr:hypothetical protein [Candidatus Pacearchaeota archaeon]
MEINLTNEELRKINEIGELTGVDKREIVKRALKIYLDNLEKRRLDKESETWDDLSDEALINFEKEYA